MASSMASGADVSACGNPNASTTACSSSDCVGSLDGTNYGEWAAHVEQQLKAAGVWDEVRPTDGGAARDGGTAKPSSTSDTIAMRQRSTLANAIILSTVDAPVLQHVLMSAKPSQLWKLLRQRYRQGLVGETADAWQQLVTMQHDPRRSSVVDHIARLDEAMRALTTQVGPLDARLQTLLLLNSVQDSNASLVRKFRERNALPTKEELVGALVLASMSPPAMAEPRGTDSRDLSETAASTTLTDSTTATSSTSSSASCASSSSFRLLPQVSDDAESAEQDDQVASPASSSHHVQAYVQRWCPYCMKPNDAVE